MDALERLKSEMAKYGDIEPKERDERWRTVLSKKTENNSISYADALERLKSETAKYEDIEPKERDKKATLDAQAKALLENAKRLIDEHGETRSGDLMWSDLEDAVIAFALAALAEKGGGAGAFASSASPSVK